MDAGIDFRGRAEIIPYDIKKQFLLGMPELDLHGHLKILLEKKDPKSLVEITHGNDEYGRDLVIKQESIFGDIFTGIVVKKGNKEGKITGQTAGNIDEIISQVRQAYSHPCLLKEIAARPVHITNVTVIFVGTLTGGAAKRIDAEIKPNTTILCPIAWLITNISAYYPEIFFDPTVANYVQEKILALEMQHDFAHRSTILSNVYVSPWVSKIEDAEDLTGTLNNVYYSKRLPFAKLEEIINTDSRILIIGDPGTGKTTAMTKIAIDTLNYGFDKKQGKETEKIELPIFTRACDLIKLDYDNFINKYLSPLPISKYSVKIMLVDGVDELKEEKRADLIKKADEYASKLNCGLIISSRKISAIKTVFSSFDRYEILPFEYDQALKLIEHLVSEKELITVLKEGIGKNELKLTLTPLSLELLIEIATVEKEIPASLTEIYERYVDAVTGKFDRIKGIESLFQYFIKKMFLAELAWEEFYKKRRLAVSKDSFNAFVTKYCMGYGWDEIKLRQFIAEIERAGLLRIGDDISFRHRSFLDYFIALWVKENPEKMKDLTSLIIDMYFNDLWTDAVFYYIGLKRTITPEIIDRIVSYSKTDFNTNLYKLMIGRLLQAGWYSPSDTKIQGIKAGIGFVEPVRAQLDTMFNSQPKPVPMILGDFFIMALTEYSYGSKTIAAEINMLCKELHTQTNMEPIRQCLLLLWANRFRIPQDEIVKATTEILKILDELEKQGKIETKEKFISLFILRHIVTEDEKTMNSLARKLNRFRRLYRNEMKKLLPPGRKK